MSNKTYDTLKWIALIFLPAIGALYFSLSSIWGLPYAEQIVGTITAIDTFLGVLLGIQNQKYIKSDKPAKLLIDKNDPEQIICSIDNLDIENLANGEKVMVVVDDKADLSDKFGAFLD